MSTTDESPKTEPSKKNKSRSKDHRNDPARFQGTGTNFRAKLIGVESVPEARGDRMCQESMQKLKSAVKSSGGHKQRVVINVSLEGLKILDEKSGKKIHHHAVHRISFIARDVTDGRAFGYIYSPGDGHHNFFGIKTEKAAESLVLSLRDLFQVVFEMKKKEVEEAKRQKEENKENFAKEFDRDSIDSRDSRTQETSHQLTIKTKFPEPTQAPRQSAGKNLLHLETQLENLEQGLQQISAFGQDQWGVAPGSPGGWSAGSDSWGTPSTPRSVNQAPADTSSSQSASQPSVVSAGGGFPTLPHPSHNVSIPTLPPPTKSGTAKVIPTLAKPGTSPMSKTLPRPTTVHSQSVVTGIPPAKPASWATFDSPSPPGAPPTVALGQKPSLQAPPTVALPQKPSSQAPPTVALPQPSLQAPPTAVPSQKPSSQAPATVALTQKAGLQAPNQSDTKNISFSEPTITTASVKDTSGQEAATASFGLPAVDDPFGNDPFFSSTPDTGSLAASDKTEQKEDKYAVFSDLSQPSFSTEDTSTIKGGTSNPFADSSLFATSMTGEASSPPSHSAINAAFASTPIQPPTSASEAEPDITSIPPDTEDTLENSAELSFKAGVKQDNKPSTDQPQERDFSPAHVVKPTLLKLSEKPTKSAKSSVVQASLGISAPYDPFGDPVSPATEAKLNSSVGASDDPFDTSAVLLPLMRGPFDLSHLKPVSLGHSAGAVSAADTASFSIHEESPEKTPPLPSMPPPPLPIQGTLDPDVAPTPPPRPGFSVSNKSSSGLGSLKKQMTFDSMEAVPPPIPKRPPVTSSDSNHSSKLLRQSTIQFPLEADVPPPPPPRPTTKTDPPTRLDTKAPTSKLVDTGRMASVDNVLGTQSISRPRPKTEKPEAMSQQTSLSDPFAVTLPQTKSKSSSSKARPRPRPRAKTPANTSSGLSLVGETASTERPSSVTDFRDTNKVTQSFGKGSVDILSSSQTQKPSHLHAAVASGTKQTIVDPFEGVDPFADVENEDPFSGMPDPFESPQDPFSKNFSGELFTTKAVTLSTSDPPPNGPERKQSFKEDPFKDDPFATDPFGTNSLTTVPGAMPNDFCDTTSRTDTSLDASVSLPAFCSSVETSSTFPEDTSASQAGLSFDTTSTAQANDPFRFDVFSNDFFKNQFNGSNLNGSANNTNSSWAFNCTTNDLITGKTSAPWASGGKATSTPGQSNATSLQNTAQNTDRSSPGLHPGNIPYNKDNDSSSNSEIADAFGDDAFTHQVSASAGDMQPQNKGAVFGNHGNPFL